VTWLLTHQKYEELVNFFEDNGEDPRDYAATRHIDNVGDLFMNQMLANQEYDKAIQNCRRLYKRNVKSWETGICLFGRIGIIDLLTPHIPTHNPTLSTTTYEFILKQLLDDKKADAFLKATTTWPSVIYNDDTITSYIALKLTECQNPEDSKLYASIMAKMHIGK